MGKCGARKLFRHQSHPARHYRRLTNDGRVTGPRTARVPGGVGSHAKGWTCCTFMRERAARCREDVSARRTSVPPVRAGGWRFKALLVIVSQSCSSPPLDPTSPTQSQTPRQGTAGSDQLVSIKGFTHPQPTSPFRWDIPTQSVMEAPVGGLRHICEPVKHVPRDIASSPIRSCWGARLRGRLP